MIKRRDQRARRCREDLLRKLSPTFAKLVGRNIELRCSCEPNQCRSRGATCRVRTARAQLGDERRRRIRAKAARSPSTLERVGGSVLALRFRTTAAAWTKRRRGAVRAVLFDETRALGRGVGSGLRDVVAQAVRSKIDSTLGKRNLFSRELCRCSCAATRRGAALVVLRRAASRVRPVRRWLAFSQLLLRRAQPAQRRGMNVAVLGTVCTFSVSGGSTTRPRPPLPSMVRQTLCASRRSSADATHRPADAARGPWTGT